MGREFISTLAAVITSILGLAVLSVILSKNANTSSVIGAVTGGLSEDIKAATGPVSGSFGLGG
jgi:hypothetical protein